MQLTTFAMIVLLVGTSLHRADAHSVNYKVERTTAVVVKVFYSNREVASYSGYEVFAPGDDQPYMKGRTDRNGFLAFMPDRAGRWSVKVTGESEHGFHGATIEVNVDQAMQVESFDQPLVATHTRLFVGIGVIAGIFGVVAMLRRRKGGRDA